MTTTPEDRLAAIRARLQATKSTPEDVSFLVLVAAVTTVLILARLHIGG